MIDLATKIEAIFASRAEKPPHEFDDLFAEFLNLLNRGSIRAAEPEGSGWKVNSWVKKGILLGFRYGIVGDFSVESGRPFFDKCTFPLKAISLADRVRLVPGGTSVRTGSYLAPGVVIMPPAYVNTGAYVDSDTMIDSHALVGSCAQIGRRVHLSAGVQIGGVLEPVGAQPVIIEDDVLVGGNCGVYEGTRVCKGAVVGAGTIFTRSIPVFDLVQEKILRGGPSDPLTIPQNAVVVPGARPAGGSAFAEKEKLQLQCAIIIKYRDENTDRATALEAALR